MGLIYDDPRLAALTLTRRRTIWGPCRGSVRARRKRQDESCDGGHRYQVSAKRQYCDYYSFMSLTDFLAWVERNDGSEPDISHVRDR